MEAARKTWKRPFHMADDNGGENVAATHGPRTKLTRLVDSAVPFIPWSAAGSSTSSTCSVSGEEYLAGGPLPSAPPEGQRCSAEMSQSSPAILPSINFMNHSCQQEYNLLSDGRPCSSSLSTAEESSLLPLMMPVAENVPSRPASQPSSRSPARSPSRVAHSLWNSDRPVRPIHVNQLPIEVFLHHILPCLTLSNMLRVARVCRLWYRYARISLSLPGPGIPRPNSTAHRACHPLVLALHLPPSTPSFCILSMKDWVNIVFFPSPTNSLIDQESNIPPSQFETGPSSMRAESSFEMWSAARRSSDAPRGSLGHESLREPETDEVGNNSVDLRRLWLRTLSKKKKLIPLHLHNDFRHLLSALVCTYIHQNSYVFPYKNDNNVTTEQRAINLTSMLYRTLSIILGLHDRHNGPALFQQTDRYQRNDSPEWNDITNDTNPRLAGGTNSSTPDVMRYIMRIIGTPEQLAAQHEVLIPAIIRSLFWIHKEKWNKRRLVLQVENIFLALPPLLIRLPPDGVRRFIKGLSDEARALKNRIITQQSQEQQTVAIPREGGLDAGEDNAELMEVDPQVSAAQNDTTRRHTAPRVNHGETPRNRDRPPDPHTPGPAQPIHIPAQMLSSSARRPFEPIKLAVMVCASTATLYPHCFNATTLATVIRNTFNLIAWGFPVAEVKYNITMLVMRILWESDGTMIRYIPPSQSSAPTDPSASIDSQNLRESDIVERKEKLQSIVNILEGWLATMGWNVVRTWMSDVCDLIRVHIRKMEMHSANRMQPLASFE